MQKPKSWARTPWRTLFAEQIPSGARSPLTVVILNSALVLVLNWVIMNLVPSLGFSIFGLEIKIPINLTGLVPQCTLPIASATGLSVLLVLGLHAFWRWSRPTPELTATDPISSSDKVQPVPKHALAVKLCDTLHPWFLSERGLLIFGAVLLVTAYYYCLSPFTPFTISSEPTPLVETFRVHNAGNTVDLKPGGTMQVSAGSPVTVQAIIARSASPNCAWTSLAGNPLAEPNCSTRYSLPIGQSNDALTVHVQSACNTSATSQNIFFVRK